MLYVNTQDLNSKMVMQFITQSNVFIKLILRFIIGIKYQANSTAAAKSLQLCPTQCDPIDGSPPDSPVPGIIQARILEWVTISFSNVGK